MSNANSWIYYCFSSLIQSAIYIFQLILHALFYLFDFLKNIICMVYDTFKSFLILVMNNVGASVSYFKPGSISGIATNKDSSLNSESYWTVLSSSWSWATQVMEHASHSLWSYVVLGTDYLCALLAWLSISLWNLIGNILCSMWLLLCFCFECLLSSIMALAALPGKVFTVRFTPPHFCSVVAKLFPKLIS